MDTEWRWCELCVRQIVTKPSRSLSLRLKNKSRHDVLRNLGEITVHAEETVASRSAVEMVLRCTHLDNKDFFSKSVCILFPHVAYLSACLFFIWLAFWKNLSYSFFLQDPFLRISRMVETGGYVPICKTEVIDDNLNPKWKPLCLSVQKFGNKVSLSSLGLSFDVTIMDY